jgi:hypothetical protein
VLEAYVPDRFETQTHIKGLVVFLRNLTLFALVLAFVSLANAVGFTQWLIAIVCSAIGTVTLLTCRWDADHAANAKSRKHLNGIAAVVTVAGILLPFLLASPSQELYLRAAFLVAAATLVVAIIGMVEYYYHDAILLHAYFACQEYKVVPHDEPGAGNERIMMIARELIRKVGEASREAKPRETRKT